MPPKEECPNCHQIVLDWHVEWYVSEGPALYKGLVAMDCPLCGQRVGFQLARIGPAPTQAVVVKRSASKAAEWATFQAVAAGGTLGGYLSKAAAGLQYASYWPQSEIQQADATEQAKLRSP
jgi:hypothetical protein